MTQKFEDALRQKSQRKIEECYKLLDGGLYESVGRAGGVLSGFSVRLNGDEVLMTLRVELAGRSQVAFVVSDDLPNVIRKVNRLARGDKLQFRDSKF